MAIKTLRVFQEFTSEGYVPMPPAGNIDYGYTIAGTFPGTTPATFQTDDPDIDVNVTTMTDFYVWIRSHGTEWNINYTRNVRVYPDSPAINNVVMGIIIANFENALPSGGTTGQILAKIDNTDYNAQWIDNYADWTSQLKHEVRAGVALTKGQAVYVSSADGTNMIVSKASNASESTSSKTLGLIAQNLSVNGKGFVITEGLLSGLNTSSATVGDAVWLGTDGNLIYGLANKPVAPAHLVFIGIVTRVNNSNGEIFVKVQNGFELREIHDVLITSPTNNQGLLYDSASTLWKNADVQLPISLTNTGSSGASTFIGNVLNIPNYTLVGLGGVPTTRTITINGTTYDLSADRTWTISSGTVTSVAATVPTGFAISGSPITTSGTLAIAFAAGYSLPTDAKQAQWDTAYNNRIVTASMPLQVDLNNISIYQSSPTSNGYLSSTDWITFNNKQNALNGSGFVKASGTTITYDNSTYVPTSRTLTINGVTFDLSANRSWTVGSELTASAPLSITGGVISISQATNTTNGFLSSTDWATFNAKQSALSGTGFVKVSGTTVSYDNTAYTPTSRLLTINGTSYDLSADRSWTITPGSGMRNIQTFTATSGQTTFTITGGYTVGLVDVFVNGTRLSTSDFTATNGTTVVLGVGVVANDIVDVVNYTASLTSGITGSGTNGYLPRWSSTSNLTNSIIFNSASGIGINTTTPRASLDVVGTIYSRDIWIEDNYNLLFGNLTTGASSTYIYGVGGDGVTNYLGFATNGSEKMRILANGNLGIGTTNPSEKLSVIGNIRIDNGAADGGQLVLASSGFSDWNIDNFSGSLRAYYNATEYFRINSSGNMGVGTTSPAARLDVSGNDVNRVVLRVANNNVPNGDKEINMFVGGTSAFGITSWQNSGVIESVAGLSSNFVLSNYQTGAIIFQNSGRLERARITAGGAFAVGNQGNGTGYGIETLNSFNQPRTVLVDNSVYTGVFKSSGGLVTLSNDSNNALTLNTNAVERMRITSGGIVCIAGAFNAYSSDYKLQIGTESGNNGIVIRSGNTSLGKISFDTGTNGDGVGRLWYNFSTNSMQFYTSTNGTNSFERMRIGSSGQVMINTTSDAYGDGSLLLSYSAGKAASFLNLDGGGGYCAVVMRRTASNGGLTEHYVGGTYAGGISVSGSSSSYNTSSDYRLKEDLKPINGLDKVSKINVYDFKWKNSDERMDGVIAHELQEILPYAVFGEKDGKQMQGVDYSKIVPVLVQAIKELNAKLEAK